MPSTPRDKINQDKMASFLTNQIRKRKCKPCTNQNISGLRCGTVDQIMERKGFEIEDRKQLLCHALNQLSTSLFLYYEHCLKFIWYFMIESRSHLVRETNSSLSYTLTTWTNSLLTT